MSTESRKLYSDGNAELPGRTVGEAIDYDYYVARAHALRSEVVANLFGQAGRAALRLAERLVLNPLARRRARKRTYWKLASLDDRMLKDIGLSRSDIRAVAAGTWETASPHSQYPSVREMGDWPLSRGKREERSSDGDQRVAA